MTAIKEKLRLHFSDEKLIDNVIQALESASTNTYIKEVVDGIVAGTSALELLKLFFLKSKAEEFNVNIPLADCFTLISKLTSINNEERRFALDMSTFLSQGNDGRDPSFRAVDLFGYIHWV